MSKKKSKVNLPAINGQEPKSKSINSIILAAVIAVVSFGIYYGILDHEFVRFDDVHIVKKFAGLEQKGEGIGEIFNDTFGGSFFRPVLSLSFWLDVKIDGGSPGQYYLQNVILHVLASLSLFAALLSMGINRYIAFTLGMIAAVHPILTPAVAWMPGRNDTLITIFVLLTFIFFKKYQQAEGTNILYLTATVLFMAISIYTKEVAAVLPALCIIYLWLCDRKNIVTQKNIVLYGLWAVIGAIYAYMRHSALSTVTIKDEIGIGALMENILSLPAIIGKMLLPIKMNGCTQYDDLSIFVGLITIVLMIVLLAVAELRKSKLYILGLLWLLLFILPTLIMSKEIQNFNYLEHRAYVPLFGFLLMLAAVVKWLAIDKNKNVSIGLPIIIIIVLAGRTYAYQQQYENEEIFWKKVADDYPEKIVGHLNLGRIYLDSGRVDESIVVNKRAIEVRQDIIDVYVNLSNAYFGKKDYENAIKYAKEALRIKPEHNVANHNIGAAYTRLDKWQEAIPYYETSEKGAKKHPEWHRDNAAAYFHTKAFDKAEQQYKKYLAYRPNDPIGYSDLGATLFNMKKFDEAEKALNKSISLNPKNYNAYITLIKMYMYFTHQYDLALATDAELKAQGGNGGELLNKHLDKVRRVTQNQAK